MGEEDIHAGDETSTLRGELGVLRRMGGRLHHREDASRGWKAGFLPSETGVENTEREKTKMTSLGRVAQLVRESPR